MGTSTDTEIPGTIPVREAHRFDEAALERHLREHVEGFRGPLAVRQFGGGQSNPTFALSAGGRRYVLRKKPPGVLLPSAHAVDREYRVISALAKTDVPVPRAYTLCEDAAVIGTPFYVMELVEGRILRDPALPGMSRAERTAIYDTMIDVLTRLHRLDPTAIGLGDYGKPGNYFSRQIGRWTKQYEMSRTDDIASMNELLRWLPANIPPGDETRLVHGDYRLENMILHPTEPRILAVLDWELSTLGHPLADLAYNCILYHSAGPTTGGLAGLDFAAAGIPSEPEYLAAYCRRTGRPAIEHWTFYLAFSLFRLAAIAQGILGRALQGNASSETAKQVGAQARNLADRAWRLAQEGDARP
jgi:aminoglycoside phosphotransferase (APT) family kinase protein